MIADGAGSLICSSIGLHEHDTVIMELLPSAYYGTRPSMPMPKTLTQKDPFQKGPIQKGLIQTGLIQKGPIQKGLIRKDFHHRFKPILHRFATQSIWQTPICKADSPMVPNTDPWVS